MATATTYEHIVLDENGIPWIRGANTKVAELVTEVQAYGWSPNPSVPMMMRHLAW